MLSKQFINPLGILNSIMLKLFMSNQNNKNFSGKIESVQYNVAVATTNRIKGISQTKLFKELGLKTLCFCRLFRHLCMFLQVKNTKFGKVSIKFDTIKS